MVKITRIRLKKYGKMRIYAKYIDK